MQAWNLIYIQLTNIHIMYHTWKTEFVTFPNREKRGEKRMHSRVFLASLKGVWKCCGQILFRVFDITSLPSKLKLKVMRKQKYKNHEMRKQTNKNCKNQCWIRSDTQTLSWFFLFKKQNYSEIRYLPTCRWCFLTLNRFKSCQIEFCFRSTEKFQFYLKDTMWFF